MKETESRPSGVIVSCEDLVHCCVARKMIDEDMMLVPGIGMGVEYNPESVLGKFGLAQLDKKSGEIVATMGFVIERGEMIITQTPQAKRPTKLSKGARSRLRSREFRVAMINQLLGIAKEMGFGRVGGVLAKDYGNVLAGVADYYYVAERVDDVFEEAGFLYNKEMDLYIKDLIS